MYIVIVFIIILITVANFIFLNNIYFLKDMSILSDIHTRQAIRPGFTVPLGFCFSLLHAESRSIEDHCVDMYNVAHLMSTRD